jgi:membrane-bound ClpP family serine protease
MSKEMDDKWLMPRNPGTLYLNMLPLDETIKQTLTDKIVQLETDFKGHVIAYCGSIDPAYERTFRTLIEDRKKNDPAGTRLVIVLTTSGGSAETVEKLVNIVRHHYQELYFVVPLMAMSAGTIFCMAGNKIFMDYSSALGPIDPQVFNGKDWVPALGYLDKVNELVEKSRNNTITNAEFLIFQSQDMAMLSRCEQARNLTITLLKKWLVQYKFADWDKHETDPAKKGQAVTTAEKEARAEEIAKDLGNNQKWHSHGRYINMDTLRRDIRLKIEDLSDNEPLREKVRAYNDLLIDYMVGRSYTVFFHSKVYF